MRPIKHFLVAPPLIFFVLISLIPLLFTLGLSLTNYSMGGAGSWVGLNNYLRLMQDSFFTRSFLNTLLFVVIGLTLQYCLGLGLALLVNSLTRSQRPVRLMILVPFMLPPLIIGFIWQMLFDSRYGPMNAFLKSVVGIPPVLWLTDPLLAFIAIIIVDTWQWTPFMFLILFAGLRMLPREPFEAARVDGASGWQIFWDMTFPMLLPVSIGAIMLRGIEAFKLFDIVFFITGGGPGSATSTLTLTGYFTALRSGNMGYGAAMSFLLLLSVIIITTLLLMLVRSLMARPDISGKRALERYRLQQAAAGGSDHG